MNVPDDIVNLMSKDFSGEISDVERISLDEWLQESGENTIYYNDMKKIFIYAPNLKSWQTFDTDAAWLKFKTRLSQRQTDKEKTKIVSLHFSWRLAAAVVILLGAGYLGYMQFFSVRDAISIATTTNTQSNVLPDGTQVFLNKNSKISYEYSSISKIKKVKLEGEAFFNVSHEQKGQLVLELDGVTIEDIGTAFNVKANPNDSIIEVFVESGEVAFYSKNNPGIHLIAGETGLYSHITKAFEKEIDINENIMAYKNGVFVFEEARMSTVIASINEVYAVKLKLENEALGNCRITVKFNNESIDMIAEVLAQTLNLTLEKNKNEIILKGNECNK